MKLKDETGNRYGHLVVLRRTENHTKTTQAAWLCHCDCGNEASILGGNLRSGASRSCGCQLSTRLPQGAGAMRDLIRRYKRQAKERDIAWHLSEKQFKKLTGQPCRYCGTDPSQRWGTARHNGYYFYNGIDRVDNSLEYIFENCVPCCGTCNNAKHSMAIDEFVLWIIRVYHHIHREE